MRWLICFFLLTAVAYTFDPDKELFGNDKFRRSYIISNDLGDDLEPIPSFNVKTMDLIPGTKIFVGFNPTLCAHLNHTIYFSIIRSRKTTEMSYTKFELEQYAFMLQKSVQENEEDVDLESHRYIYNVFKINKNFRGSQVGPLFDPPPLLDYKHQLPDFITSILGSRIYFRFEQDNVIMTLYDNQIRRFSSEWHLTLNDKNPQQTIKQFVIYATNMETCPVAIMAMSENYEEWVPGQPLKVFITGTDADLEEGNQTALSLYIFIAAMIIVATAIVMQKLYMPYTLMVNQPIWVQPAEELDQVDLEIGNENVDTPSMEPYKYDAPSNCDDDERSVRRPRRVKSLDRGVKPLKRKIPSTTTTRRVPVSMDKSRRRTPEKKKAEKKKEAPADVTQGSSSSVSLKRESTAEEPSRVKVRSGIKGRDQASKGDHTPATGVSPYQQSALAKATKGSGSPVPVGSDVASARKHKNKSLPDHPDNQAPDRKIEEEPKGSAKNH